MQNSPDPKDSVANASLRSAVTLIVFGFGILAFLVAIDRPEWFHLRPSTGTAIALSHAAEQVGNNAAQQK
ncbi:MAG: hypothetical protein ABW164_11260 [Sphingobium sp.]